MILFLSEIVDDSQYQVAFFYKSKQYQDGYMYICQDEVKEPVG